MLHLGIWQKKNKKLKRKCQKLSRALVNIKLRCLMKKPRMMAAPRKKRRGLDVLAEVSRHMNWRRIIKILVAWGHEPLHNGGMLSLKFASFPYTFLYLFHSPEPSQLSISLYINCKRESNMFFNYIFVSVVWFRFCSFSCEILPLSAAAATFRSHFVKVYVTGVLRKNEPHGQVRNDVEMVRVLLAWANSSK